MTLTRYLRLSLLLVASAGVSACSKPAEAPAAPPHSVSTLVVEAGQTVPTARLSGEVKAQVEQSVAFRTAGRVVEVLASSGDHVVAGQVLARLDNADQTVNLELAQATVRSSQAQLDEAQRSFERMDALFQAGNATRAQADAARATRDSAAGALAAAQSQSASAEELVSFVALTATFEAREGAAIPL